MDGSGDREFSSESSSGVGRDSMNVILSFEVEDRSPSDIATILLETLNAIPDFEASDCTLKCGAYSMLRFPSEFPNEPGDHEGQRL